MKKRKWKTYDGVIGDVSLSDLEELGNECQEVVDNAIAQTQRIQTLEDTASTLTGFSFDDAPEFLSDVAISWMEILPRSKRMQLSRADRRDNAIAPMQAAIDAARKWCDDKAEDDPEGQEAKGHIDEAQAWADALEQIVEDASNAEFPEMYG